MSRRAVTAVSDLIETRNGHVVEVTLDCGHVKSMNPIYTYRVGNAAECQTGECGKTTANAKIQGGGVRSEPLRAQNGGRVERRRGLRLRIRNGDG